jgi:hypothetical protein
LLFPEDNKILDEVADREAIQARVYQEKPTIIPVQLRADPLSGPVIFIRMREGQETRVGITVSYQPFNMECADAEWVLSWYVICTPKKKSSAD